MPTKTETGQPATTSVTRYVTMDPEYFGTFVAARVSIVDDIGGRLHDFIDQGKISPVEAGQALAGVVGALFGTTPEFAAQQGLQLSRQLGWTDGGESYTR